MKPDSCRKRQHETDPLLTPDLPQTQTQLDSAIGATITCFASLAARIAGFATYRTARMVHSWSQGWRTLAVILGADRLYRNMYAYICFKWFRTAMSHSEDIRTNVECILNQDERGWI